MTAAALFNIHFKATVCWHLQREGVDKCLKVFNFKIVAFSECSISWQLTSRQFSNHFSLSPWTNVHTPVSEFNLGNCVIIMVSKKSAVWSVASLKIVSNNQMFDAVFWCSCETVNRQGRKWRETSCTLAFCVIKAPHGVETAAVLSDWTQPAAVQTVFSPFLHLVQWRTQCGATHPVIVSVCVTAELWQSQFNTTKNSKEKSLLCSNKRLLPKR